MASSPRRDISTQYYFVLGCIGIGALVALAALALFILSRQVTQRTYRFFIANERLLFPPVNIKTATLKRAFFERSPRAQPDSPRSDDAPRPNSAAISILSLDVNTLREVIALEPSIAERFYPIAIAKDGIHALTSVPIHSKSRSFLNARMHFNVSHINGYLSLRPHSILVRNKPMPTRFTSYFATVNYADFLYRRPSLAHIKELLWNVDTLALEDGTVHIHFNEPIVLPHEFSLLLQSQSPN